MNSTIDDRITGVQDLDEPHFDEEATIAARPVVPLGEVKAENRSKAGFAVALAIGGGLLIGLLTATLIYRYLGASQAPTVETTTVAEQPANQLPSEAGGAAVGVEDSAVTSVEEDSPVETVSQTREPLPENEASKPVRNQDRSPEVASRRPVVVRESRPPIGEEDEEVARASRRAERQEGRRERRRAKRQERQSGQTADDLTRIREIFEGSPRP
ncbi:MAG TPA: hypothetical protein VJU84_14965 [Pyrinomonadaceae bacterium]|nr:hypothetical protein [Pyrinomonadaceae bacterium]